MNSPRMSGPMIKPATPKASSPPNTPMITVTGCMSACALTTYGLSTLSICPMMKKPTSRRMIACVVLPIMYSQMAMGIHTA